MAVDIAGSPRPSFDLKSAQLPVVALWLKTTDAGIFAEELAQRWGDDPDFFDNDPVLIDLSHVQDEPEPIDFPAVLALLRQYRTLPVAVRGGSAAQMQAAHDVGLSAAPEVIAARAAEAPLAEPVAVRPAKNRNKTSSAAAPEQEPPVEPAAAQAEAVLAAAAVHPSQQDKPSTDIMAAPAAEPMGIASVAVAEPQEASESMRLRPTMVLDKPLRSGQQVYARGSDLVVMAVVSFGAEVIADGNIHVYAPLRGRAIAGARGDSAARIFTTCMEPQLVSIAGIYRTTEVAIAKDILGKPAQVRLDGEKLLIERL